MKNTEIIKNSILFPIRKYKEFTIITLLFLLSEIIQELVLHNSYNDITIIPVSFILILLPLFVLGINLQIIFHIIDDNRGLPKLSFKKSLKIAMQDYLLELYYLIFTIVITFILTIAIEIFNNPNAITALLNNIMIEIEASNVMEIIGSLPGLMDLYSRTIMICLLIFVVTLTVMFSMCTLSKIDMEVNHNFKQALNIIHMLNLIKKIGILKYLGFLALVIIICVIVANIVYILNFSPIIGSFLSAFLEAYSLVFFLFSFAQLYPN